MFDTEDHPDSLAGNLVRFVGRTTVDRIKAVGLMAIVAFWVVVVLWLMLMYFG